MKKVFPVIIVLICLSLFGLMFIQLNWVKTTMEVQKIKYSFEIENVINKTRSDLRSRLAMVRGLNPNFIRITDLNSDNFLWSGVSTLPEADIRNIIQTHLNEEKIKLPFEYCITLRGMVENNSRNFRREMFESAYQAPLTLDGSYGLILYIEEPKNYISQRTAWMFGAAALFTIIIIAAFALTIRTMFNQKKIAEIKSDFINNMTHEFKTPLATISLASDALSMEKVRKNPDMLDYYAGIIKSENKRMNKQVEKILQAAQIDKDDLKLKLQPINVHDVIEKMTESFSLQIEQQNGTLASNLLAKKSLIMADEVHFSNIIYNLMDNAVKYSGDHVKLEISTANSKGNVVIKIKDSGIGMNKETQMHIFEKFYRAHTGNLHNIKGFGLGLSYVKAIVESHKGKIKVDSALGKGSTFTIELPLSSEEIA
ncbi:sensor histidine kinase [Edaphocola aurantiacus]|uniref:sensor histidine kinase n=1 Tax=Edaphocola aurantiacus TaxID=2601682 RepID=UPI001C95CA11|nr:HAMP domain-containing sensor histidine kinase [Edaphocola aurantiacus]